MLCGVEGWGGRAGVGVGMCTRCMRVCWWGWGAGAGGSGVLRGEGSPQAGNCLEWGTGHDLGLGQQGPESPARSHCPMVTSGPWVGEKCLLGQEQRESMGLLFRVSWAPTWPTMLVGRQRHLWANGQVAGTVLSKLLRNRASPSLAPGPGPGPCPWLGSQLSSHRSVLKPIPNEWHSWAEKASG